MFEENSGMPEEDHRKAALDDLLRQLNVMLNEQYGTPEESPMPEEDVAIEEEEGMEPEPGMEPEGDMSSEDDEFEQQKREFMKRPGNRPPVGKTAIMIAMGSKPGGARSKTAGRPKGSKRMSYG